MGVVARQRDIATVKVHIPNAAPTSARVCPKHHRAGVPVARGRKCESAVRQEGRPSVDLTLDIGQRGDLSAREVDQMKLRFGRREVRIRKGHRHLTGLCPRVDDAMFDVS